VYGVGFGHCFNKVFEFGFGIYGIGATLDNIYAYDASAYLGKEYGLKVGAIMNAVDGDRIYASSGLLYYTFSDQNFVFTPQAGLIYSEEIIYAFGIDCKIGKSEGVILSLAVQGGDNETLSLGIGYLIKDNSPGN